MGTRVHAPRGRPIRLAGSVTTPAACSRATHTRYRPTPRGSTLRTRRRSTELGPVRRHGPRAQRSSTPQPRAPPWHPQATEVESFCPAFSVQIGNAPVGPLLEMSRYRKQSPELVVPARGVLQYAKD